MLPPALMIYITDQCTLTCAHCFWRARSSDGPRHMPWRVIEGILEECRRNSVYMIGVSGGDPVLHPRFLDVLASIRSKGMMPLVGMTGVGVDERLAAGIYAAGAPSVQVSLDGSSENVNRRYRGDGSFDEIRRGIGTLQGAGLKVNLAVCVDRDNEDDVEGILEMAAAMGIFKVKLQVWRDPGRGLRLYPNEALDAAGREHVGRVVRGFEAKRGIHGWIQYAAADTTGHVQGYHDSNLIVFPDGEVMTDELGDPLGRYPDRSLEDIHDGRRAHLP